MVVSDYKLKRSVLYIPPPSKAHAALQKAAQQQNEVNHKRISTKTTFALISHQSYASLNSPR